MTEMLKQKGRLLEEEQKAKELKLKIEGLINSVRDLVDPFDKIEDLKLDVAAKQCLELAHFQIQYKESLATIGQIKKYLRA